METEKLTGVVKREIEQIEAGMTKGARGRGYSYTRRIEHLETLEEGQRDIKAIVGENVHKYRLEAGLKRTAFARLAGYQGANVKRLEEGGLNIGIEKLQQIANILNVTVIDLIEDWSEVE